MNQQRPASASAPARSRLQRPGERFPLRIEALEAYDIEPALIDIWRETIGPHLLPVQERAIKEFNLFGGGNLVVFSPTSSGKTFIGEMAAVKAARANTRVFYLVPQRALADEKYREQDTSHLAHFVPRRGKPAPGVGHKA